MAILENTYWHSAELTICHPEFSPVATLDPTAICVMSFRSVWHWHTDNPWVSVIGWPLSLFFSNHLSAVSLLCLELKNKNRALFHPLKSREIHNFCLSTWILLLWSKLEVLDNHSWHWFKAPYLCLSRVCIYLILKATRWGGYHYCPTLYPKKLSHQELNVTHPRSNSWWAVEPGFETSQSDVIVQSLRREALGTTLGEWDFSTRSHWLQSLRYLLIASVLLS